MISLYHKQDIRGSVPGHEETNFVHRFHFDTLYTFKQFLKCVTLFVSHPKGPPSSLTKDTLKKHTYTYTQNAKLKALRDLSAKVEYAR